MMQQYLVYNSGLFPIVQHGTCWYHSYAMLQEQNGMYVAIVIHGKEKQETIVRMLSGEKPSDSSLVTAREMIAG